MTTEQRIAEVERLREILKERDMRIEELERTIRRFKARIAELAPSLEQVLEALKDPRAKEGKS